jgi:OHCU decarboxylase
LSDELEDRFFGALANRRWAHAVASGLFEVADRAMDTMSNEEWLEAMAAHPRIGDPGGDSPDSSVREQKRALEADAGTLAALATENRVYEDRFGRVFLIAASGRSAEEILAELRRRMKNDPVTEFEEAKRELRKIARLRLERLVSA